MIIQVIKLSMQILKISTEDQASILGKHTKLITINMPKRERYEYIKRLESDIFSFH